MVVTLVNGVVGTLLIVVTGWWEGARISEWREPGYRVGDNYGNYGDMVLECDGHC